MFFSRFLSVYCAAKTQRYRRLLNLTVVDSGARLIKVGRVGTYNFVNLELYYFYILKLAIFKILK